MLPRREGGRAIFRGLNVLEEVFRGSIQDFVCWRLVNDCMHAINGCFPFFLPENDAISRAAAIPIYAGDDRDTHCLQGGVLVKREAGLVPEHAIFRCSPVCDRVKPPYCAVIFTITRV